MIDVSKGRAGAGGHDFLRPSASPAGADRGVVAIRIKIDECFVLTMIDFLFKNDGCFNLK